MRPHPVLHQRRQASRTAAGRGDSTPRHFLVDSATTTGCRTTTTSDAAREDAPGGTGPSAGSAATSPAAPGGRGPSTGPTPPAAARRRPGSTSGEASVRCACGDAREPAGAPVGLGRRVDVLEVLALVLHDARAGERADLRVPARAPGPGGWCRCGAGRRRRPVRCPGRPGRRGRSSEVTTATRTRSSTDPSSSRRTGSVPTSVPPSTSTSTWSSAAQTNAIEPLVAVERRPPSRRRRRPAPGSRPRAASASSRYTSPAGTHRAVGLEQAGARLVRVAAAGVERRAAATPRARRPSASSDARRAHGLVGALLRRHLLPAHERADLPELQRDVVGRGGAQQVEQRRGRLPRLVEVHLPRRR